MRVLYMRPKYISHHISILLRMRNVSDTSCIEKHTFCVQQLFFFFKNCAVYDNVEKYCTAGQATDGNMTNAHCMLDA